MAIIKKQSTIKIWLIGSF